MIQKEKVTVIAPATTANLGPGFDVFGMALQKLHDKITVTKRSDRKVVIESISGIRAKDIPFDSKRNSASLAALSVIDKADAEIGLNIEIEKGIRPCAGFGSSGASSAAAALATNILLGNHHPLGIKDLIISAAEGEKVTCGFAHVDNVAASLLGGFVLIRSYDPLETLHFDVPENLGIVAILPDIMVKTMNSRNILPNKVPLIDVKYNVGNASALVAGILTKDISLIGDSMKDVIVEPRREKLIPCFKDAKRAALENGALGVAISGSGPAIVSIYDKHLSSNGKNIGKAMQDVFSRHGIDSIYYITASGEGAKEVKGDEI